MRHFKDPAFRPLYDALPAHLRRLADRNFAPLKRDPKHASVRGDLWSARVGRSNRALASENEDGFQWFWIGSHADYDEMIR